MRIGNSNRELRKPAPFATPDAAARRVLSGVCQACAREHRAVENRVELKLVFLFFFDGHAAPRGPAQPSAASDGRFAAGTGVRREVRCRVAIAPLLKQIEWKYPCLLEKRDRVSKFGSFADQC